MCADGVPCRSHSGVGVVTMIHSNHWAYGVKFGQWTGWFVRDQLRALPRNPTPKKAKRKDGR